jgi:hypothetical protein
VDAPVLDVMAISPVSPATPVIVVPTVLLLHPLNAAQNAPNSRARDTPDRSAKTLNLKSTLLKHTRSTKKPSTGHPGMANLIA